MNILERAVKLAQAAAPAVAGSRGSDTTFALACALVHGFCLTAEDAFQVMRDHWNSRCVPPWNEADLSRKVNHAAFRGGPPPGKRPGWFLDATPAVHPAAQGGNPKEVDGAPGYAGIEVKSTLEAEPARNRFNMAKLKAKQFEPAQKKAWWQSRSCIRRPGDCSVTRALETIFQRGDKVLVFDSFRTQGQWIFWHGRGWFRLGRRPGMLAEPCPEPTFRGPDGAWFLSNPVSGLWSCLACDYTHSVTDGILPDRRCPKCGPASLGEAIALGRVLSRRSERAVVAFRHLVLEHDPPKGADPVEHAQLWAGFVALLPLPLVSFTTSGGESIHALLRLPAKDKMGWDEMRAVAVKYLAPFGADPAAMKAVQLTRLPNAWRGPNKQECLYLDPSPGETPVAERE